MRTARNLLVAAMLLGLSNFMVATPLKAYILEDGPYCSGPDMYGNGSTGANLAAEGAADSCQPYAYSWMDEYCFSDCYTCFGDYETQYLTGASWPQCTYEGDPFDDWYNNGWVACFCGSVD
jgi:hypothetical protein